MWPDDRTRILQRFQPHGFCTNLEEVVFYTHFLHLFLFLSIQKKFSLITKQKKNACKTKSILIATLTARHFRSSSLLVHEQN